MLSRSNTVQSQMKKIEITNDTMSIKRNLMTQRKFWMNFISYIQANRAKYRNNYQQKASKWTTFMQTWIFKEKSNVTSVSRLIRLNKTEALINLQCMLASTLCND